MSQETPEMLAFRENLKQNMPGMPEKDITDMIKSAGAVGFYSNGPDSEEHENVPKGTLIDGSLFSTIYPNSKRLYKVYLPAGYDPEKSYPLMVFLDGISIYLAPPVFANIVLDNLIAAKRIPAMIAVFLDPGDNGDGMPILSAGFQGPTSNRSMEYDSTDDRFVRLLLEELLPELSKKYQFTSDPELRCICGASSGAQAAFSAAWHRSDVFHKVICHIGSFIDIRGGDCNPTRVRRSARKPLRIFIQDGEQNLNNIHGDLVLGNKRMVSALEYREYDYKYVFGKGGHNLEHAGAILPETLEWIWR